MFLSGKYLLFVIQPVTAGLCWCCANNQRIESLKRRQHCGTTASSNKTDIMRVAVSVFYPLYWQYLLLCFGKCRDMKHNWAQLPSHQHLWLSLQLILVRSQEWILDWLYWGIYRRSKSYSSATQNYRKSSIKNTHCMMPVMPLLYYTV